MPEGVPKHVRERRNKRQARLLELGYKNYAEYLGAPHWQDVKDRYRSSNWLPQECICGDTDVHLHHMTYERIGEERLEDLTPLCRTCHTMIHTLEWRGMITLDFDGVWDRDRAIAGRKLLLEATERRRAEMIQILRDEQEHILSLSFAARLMRAVDRARASHFDISSDVRLLRMLSHNGAKDHILFRRLVAIERKAYRWPDWNGIYITEKAA